MADIGIFDLCAFCPSLCMDRCPVVAATGSNTWTPQSKMMTGWLMVNGHRQMDALNAATIYQCTGCMSCHDVCLHEIDVEQALFGLRRKVVEAGACPWPSARFVDNGQDLQQIYVDSVPPDYVVPEASGVVFPGSGTLRTSPNLLKDLFECFGRLGVDTFAAVPSVADDSGYDLYAAGYIAEFREHAGHVAKKLRRYKAVMVVSPTDYYAFKVLYPMHDIKLPDQVIFAEEHLGKLALARQPGAKMTGRIAYHDSCITGRHLEIYDLPRRVIEHASGQPPIELRRHHQDSMCCGASGAWDIVNPKGSADAGANVARMACDAGANILVTSGCKCAANIGSKLHGLEVMDLITFVAKSTAL
ncbi:MAG TPA: (Fe-S)-binding protein [Myxococcota bacterium]|nr:(Fe-S)-binding protein [Myxococcota bacterium]